MSTIAIVGSGNFGANAALFLAEEDLGHITLIDIKDGYAAGKALDLMESAPVRRFEHWICASNDIAAIAGAQIVVIAAGHRRRPGMTREELLPENLEIVRPIFRDVRALAPDAIVIVQPQPVDMLTLVAIEEFGFDPAKVVGLSSMLDTARFRFFLAQALGVSPLDTSAVAIGRHGKNLVCLDQYANISGIPLADMMSAEQIEAVVDKTRRAGDQIVDLLQIGAAYYAPATCLVELVSAINRDQRRFMPVSVYGQGAYGINGVCMGLPVVMNRNGVERVVEVELRDAQLEVLKRCEAELIELKKTL